MRILVLDVVQGIIVGCVLAFITVTLLANSEVMMQISSPNKAVLLIGRTPVESDSDVPTVYELAKKIRLTPLSQRR